MKRKINISLISLLLSAAAFSQNPAGTDIRAGDDVPGMERASQMLDSLLSDWYVRLAYINRPADTGAAPIPEFPDSVYQERIRRINSVITLPYNNIIRNHIHVYTQRKPEVLRAVIGLSEYYFPMIEDIFDYYGLPAELKYMAVIESALNPNAVSRVGATGLWQFLASTGRMYGLTINSVVDERRDPVKATHAAARYMRDMYKIFNDWVLVIAAYNCGPGNVNKAIARSGNKRDYWEIYYRLPRETRGFIPQFIAATYAMNYFKEHNISPLTVNKPIATDTIVLHKDIHLSQISEVMNIPLGELRSLNPQYRIGLIPGSSRPHPLTLPVSRLSEFINLADSIRNHRTELYLGKNAVTVNPVYSSASPANVSGKSRLYYTVKDGDNLGFISEWYRVRLSDLRYWNNIYSNTIRVGQRISVFVDQDKTEYFSRINSMTFSEKQALAGKAVAVNASRTTVPVEEGDYVVHVVRAGDTIWDIVRLYQGASVAEVLSLNNISDPARIYAGQRLKIRRRA